MSRPEISRYPSRKPVLGARLPPSVRPARYRRHSAQNSPMSSYGPPHRLRSQSRIASAPRSSTRQLPACGAPWQSTVPAPSGVLRSSCRIVHSSTGCGSPIASSRLRNRSIRAAGRSLGAESRKPRPGCGGVIRCSLASSRPNCAASSGAASNHHGQTDPGRISRPRLAADVDSVASAVLSSVLDSGFGELPGPTFLPATATVRKLRHRPRDISNSAPRFPLPRGNR